MMEEETSDQDRQDPHRASLTLKLVGDVEGCFVVARYQRGYRWGKVEVESLLRDIYDNGQKPYSLQPVVVQLRDNGDWELIDGQQRLTTLYLIFRYLKSELKPGVVLTYQLTYETRPKSAEYLETLDPARRSENIDFHHLYQAHQCIHAWFQKFPANKRQLVADDLFSALMRHVHLIWYQAPRGLDATTLFARLNVGRIPLNDAELFKALLLSRAVKVESSADRPTEIAAQWDIIERDLRNPDVWAFITTGSSANRPTRITLLLEVLTGVRTDTTSGSFPVFDALRERVRAAESPQDVWNEVVDLHSLVMGWYENRSLYHKIGYLIAVNQSLMELVRLGRGTTKRQFESLLNERIGNVLNLTPSEAADLSYDSSGEKAFRMLLLMNVETIRRNVHSTERYPFRSHKAEQWSLEHIHAQNAQTLNRAEQWHEWLRLHRRALESMSPTDPAQQANRQDLLEQIAKLPADIDGTTFNHIAAQVLNFFTASEDDTGTPIESVHSISNLALLPAGANSALSNSAFEVKRQKILELDRQGQYIPVCTRQVFLKYFTGADAQQIHFWSPQDRESYLNAMIGTGPAGSGVVSPYLKPEDQA